MKLRSTVLLIALVVAFATGFQVAAASPLAQEASFVAPKLVVNTSFLNVRTGPGVDYSVLLTVVGGTELPVLGRMNDNVWFQVSTVVGVGWVNVEFTAPRGNFDRVPSIAYSDLGEVLSFEELGQGGGGSELAASTVAQASARFVLSNGKTITVNSRERFRAVQDVEAVNLRNRPEAEAPAQIILFRDVSIDFSVVGSAQDDDNVSWVALDVPDVGIGWVEASKFTLRLSRAAGQVLYLSTGTLLLNAPGGVGDGLPPLTLGQELFLRDISENGQFIAVELADGTRGWVPFSSTQGRTGTPTDEIDLSALQAQVAEAVSEAARPRVGFDIPHVVINTGFLNLRSGPGAQFSIVDTVPGGTELPVIGVTPDSIWFLVEGANGEGWVNSEFTAFRGSIARVPIIRDVVLGSSVVPTARVGDSITLYAAPGTSFGVIGVIAGPVDLQVVARNADSSWIQVNSPLGFGWVRAELVQLLGNLAVLAVVS